MATIEPRGPDGLRLLIDDPNEDLGAEYKAKINLETTLGRAKLAKHLAALANHGGGYLIVGFDDDLKPEHPRPSLPNRDDISRVVKTYLEPPFQCDVREVADAAGLLYAVVAVPSHGATPVCCRADGPQDDKGRVQGVTCGTYYIRKPGPESAPITTPAEWAPLIRRCVTAERSSLLGAIELALGGVSARVAGPTLDETLDQWDAAAAKAYAEDVQAHCPEARVATAHYRFSYAIETGGDLLGLDDLPEIMRRVGLELDREVYTGWGMFHVHPGALTPRFRTDPNFADGEVEFLEVNMVETPRPVGMTDVWRVTGTGLACIHRGYIEDTHWWKDVPPGTAFSPNQMAMNIAELVRHASLLAREFGSASQVHFRCEWRGLSGRTLQDFSRPWMFQGHPPTNDVRRSRAVATIGALEANWAAVAAELAGPVARAFGIGRLITPEWFSGESATWQKRS
ncbi:ATP-binding protein [Brevundimonas sp.]|uniref:AlbA family DNA-binding domain-containing protein n=1 Tax=Brevundimonas sp. TaxID=1871086 RepID=UPI0028AB5065|nr:ATP-binding protein [Brevundimonas sp.]